MKKIYTMFLLVLVALTVYAQHPFIQQGKSWHVIGFNQKSYMNFQHLTAPDYEIDYSIPQNSDTLIGSVNYKRIVGISEDTICSEKYIREDEGKVYCYDHLNKREELLYDFTLQTGDTFTLHPDISNELRCVVTSVRDSLFCGIKRRVIYFDAFSKNGPSTPGIPQKWIEGIGYPGGPVEEVESDCYAAGIQQLTQFVTQEIGMEGICETIYASDFNTRYYFGRYYEGGKEKEIDYDDPAIWDDEEFWENYRKDDLHYEIVNHQLHIYGYIFCSCCPQYLYLTVDKNNEIRFHLTELTDILPDCAEQHEIDMYFPGFYEDKPYTVVDRSGEGNIVDSWRPDEIASIWQEGTMWEVNYEPTSDATEGPETKAIYRLLKSDEDNYLALERTMLVDSIPGVSELQAYIRNDGDSLIYVRPVLQDGSIGAESLLYDFNTPFEYGNTIRYGVEGGGVEEEYIDWQKDSLDYYMLNGDSHLLPAWGGIIYRYGYIGGPLELFQRHYVPGRTKGPKPTNISHVIFTTKGGQKTIRRAAPQSDEEISVPYTPMLTDGTKWEYLTVRKERPQTMSIGTVEIMGDTLIGNRICKVVASPSHNINKVAFEEGRKLYLVGDDNAPSVLLDFGLVQGDALDKVTGVCDVRTIENQGNSYRAIIIDTGLDCTSLYSGDTSPWYYTLIEGIGVNKDEYLAEPLAQGEENAISYLLRCWKGGTLVYQDPFYGTTNGIRQIAPGLPPTIYDLQGRQLRNVPQKGLYITGDRKIIRK